MSALALASLLVAAACSPGDFDQLGSGIRALDAGDGGASIPDTGAEGEAGPAAGSGGDDAAGSGGDGAAGTAAAGGRGGRSGSGAGAGTGGAKAGAGGTRGGSAGAGGAGRGGAAGAGVGGSGGKAPVAGSAGQNCAPDKDPAQMSVTASELGAFAPSTWPAEFTGIASASAGDRVLLVLSGPNVFGIAAWADRAGFMASPPRLDAQRPAESLFDTSVVPPNFGVLIGSAIADGDSALIFFASAQLIRAVDTGVARVARDEARAQVLSAPGTLFPPVSADAWRPAFMHGAIAVSEGGTDYTYVYGCQSNPNNPDEMQGAEHDSPCRLARVRRSEVAIGERYQYWTGQTWGADVAAAGVVIDHANGGISVSFNVYLGKYIALNSSANNSVVLRWADRPQGPWQALGEFPTEVATGGFGTSFGAIEVPALRDACQETLYVLYSLTRDVAQADGGTTTAYSSRAVRVELR